MASISTDPRGNVRILFVGADKKRRTIRLGKITQKAANEIKLKVEHLHTMQVTKLPLDADTAKWVAGIGDDLAAKLAAVGLIPERKPTLTAGEFFTTWKAEKEAAGYKPTSVTTWGQTVAELTELFGPRRCPVSPTPTGKRTGPPCSPAPSVTLLFTSGSPTRRPCWKTPCGLATSPPTRSSTSANGRATRRSGGLPSPWRKFSG